VELAVGRKAEEYVERGFETASKYPSNTPFVALSHHPETGYVSMAEYKHSVCPVWIGYLLASPVRNLYHPPKRIIGPYVKRE
jgi:hypothetical protein